MDTMSYGTSISEQADVLLIEMEHDATEETHGHS